MSGGLEATDAVVASLLERLRGRGDYRAEIRRIAAEYPLVAFYGCGAILDSIVDTWNEQVGRRIDLCCDSDPEKWGREFAGGIPCISPQELWEVRDRCAVFVTIGQFREVFDALKSRGFPSVNLLFKYDLIASEYLANQHDSDVAANLARVRGLLADDRSREVFDKILLRALGEWNDPDLMPSVCDPDQYFLSDLVALAPDEAFVDVGAFDGDTVRDFVRRTHGRFDSITCFELDARNFEALERNVALLPQKDRIRLYNMGLWDEACDVTYSVGKSQSTIGEGLQAGRVVALDDVLPDARVTLIKMDIEGAELRALAGARRVIERQRPRLAISVYHHISHLWAVPLVISGLVPDHQIYLRHHTNLEYETVCYAVPVKEADRV
jgi:FkbM family methyltransferase